MKAGHLIAVACMAAVILAGGCASTAPTGSTGLGSQYTSLLKYPDRISPAPGAMGGYRWIAPNADFKQYDKVLISRILVTLDTSESKTVDPVTQAKLVDYFRAALVKALQPSIPWSASPVPACSWRVSPWSIWCRSTSRKTSPTRRAVRCGRSRGTRGRTGHRRRLRFCSFPRTHGRRGSILRRQDQSVIDTCNN